LRWHNVARGRGYATREQSRAVASEIRDGDETALAVLADV